MDWYKLQKDFKGLNGKMLIDQIEEYMSQVPMPTANIVYGMKELASQKAFQQLISNALNSPEYQLC